jgi:MFS family permease
MVLYGYDASVFNSVQGSKNWVAWFNTPNASVIGSINTAYTVGAIFGGFFCGGPIADYLGRKVGMGTGCVMVIIATFMQTFAPRHNLACFIAGRVLIGIGQGIALSKSSLVALFVDAKQSLTRASNSRRPHLYRRTGTF